jgi:hypothetical protein
MDTFKNKAAIPGVAQEEESCLDRSQSASSMAIEKTGSYWLEGVGFICSLSDFERP